MRAVHQDGWIGRRGRRAAQGARQKPLRRARRPARLYLHPRKIPRPVPVRGQLSDGAGRSGPRLCGRHDLPGGGHHLLLHRQRALLRRRQALRRPAVGHRKVLLLLQGGPFDPADRGLPSRRHPLPRLAGGAGSRLSARDVQGQSLLPRHPHRRDDPQPAFPGGYGTSRR